MPKKYISGLGTKADEQRRQHIRFDNSTRRELIEASRRFIFGHGIRITGARVEERLQAQSWTPTRVSISNCSFEKTGLILISERILSEARRTRFQLFFHAGLRFTA
jgi:hypothetical protein